MLIYLKNYYYITREFLIFTNWDMDREYTFRILQIGTGNFSPYGRGYFSAFGKEKSFESLTGTVITLFESYRFCTPFVSYSLKLRAIYSGSPNPWRKCVIAFSSPRKIAFLLILLGDRDSNPN